MSGDDTRSGGLLASLSTALHEQLRSAPRTCADLGERVSTLELELPGDPWARWLLVALHRHEARQAWVGEVVREHLGGDLAEIGRSGSFGHPDGDQSGEVPGMPGWKYFFHGTGCCMSRDGGEVLDVDFVDGGTEWIDPYFYRSYLKSVADGPRAERGLVCDDPYDSAWMTDIATLRDLGWVEEDHKLRLTALGRELAGALQPTAPEVDASPLGPAWYACLLGRFDVAAELTTHGEIPAALFVARDALIQERAAVLEQRVGGSEPRSALQALAALGREHAEATVVRQLRRQPLDSVVCSALDVIAEWGISDHRDAIAETMSRARGDDIPAPHVRTRCANLLMLSAAPAALGKHERKALLEALTQPGRASDGERGLLLYLLHERHGIRQLRRALASDIPVARAEAACALGVIGTTEAIEILRGVENPEAQTVLALLRGHSPVNGPEPIGKPIEWEGKQKRVYRMAEVMSAHVGDFTATCFARMHDRYGPLVRRWLAS